MHAVTALIASYARSAVVPCDGAFANLEPHQIAAPVIAALLGKANVAPDVIDAIVVGNALGAGGNPARLAGLAAGLPDRTAAFTIDSQCCAGLDAVGVGAGLIATGRARMVIAGGVEAWSRAPIRQRRPREPGELPAVFERPAFAPDSQRDPDMIESAARYAGACGITRTEQDDYAMQSHRRAFRAAAWDEIAPVAGVQVDAYPRRLDGDRVARLPVAASARAADDADCSLSRLAVSPKADGAAFVLLASADACRDLSLGPSAEWIACISAGSAPEIPLLAAGLAASRLLAGTATPASKLAAVELHDAFAVQGIAFRKAVSLRSEAFNRRGGGLARGHPIGASGAIALVRVLAELQSESPGTLGLAAIAAAGGLGAAAMVRRC